MGYQSAFDRIVYKLEHELSPLLTYHNLNHAERVLNDLDSHLKTIEHSTRETELLRLAAIGHDIGFIKTFDGHELQSIQILSSICSEEGYSDVEVDQIAKLIMATRIDIKPDNFLEKVLVDADLEYLGSDDCMLILRKLYQEWINYKLIPEDYNLFLKNSLRFMEEHRYETDFARSKSKKSQNIAKLREELDLD